MPSETPELPPPAVTVPSTPGEWLALRDCRLSGHVLPLVMLHPRLGVFILGGPEDAPALLRQRLERARFPAIFSGHLPVVRRDAVVDPLELAFADLPPLRLAGDDAWVLAARRALETEAPQDRQPVRLGILAQRRRRRRRLLGLAGVAATLVGSIGISILTVPTPPQAGLQTPAMAEAAFANAPAPPVAPSPVSPPTLAWLPTYLPSPPAVPPVPAPAGLPELVRAPPLPPPARIADQAAPRPPLVTVEAGGPKGRSQNTRLVQHTVSSVAPAAARCRQIVQRMQIGEAVPDADIRFLRRGCPG